MVTEAECRTALTGIVEEAISGSRDVNQLLQMDGLELTPLMVACQWKNFNKQSGTKFSSQTVEALLTRAGADPNVVVPSNGISALFFAVKYADLKTVDLLLEAQADVKARDRPLGRSVLFNATETCDINIISRLLERGVDASERSDRIGSGENSFPATVSEKMLLASPEAYMSWKVLGPPSIEQYVRAFERMLLAGADLGETALIFCGNALRHFRETGEKQPNAHQMSLVQAAFGLEYEGQVRTRAKPPKNAPPPPPSASPAASDSAARRPRFHDDPTRWLGGSSQHGIASLTPAQLRAECEARVGLAATPSDVSSMRALLEADQHAPLASPRTLHLDTANQVTLVLGPDRTAVLAPAQGPVCLPVRVSRPGVHWGVVRGVPVHAFVSTGSAFTILHTSLADRAGLVYSDLRPTHHKAFQTFDNSALTDLRLVDSLVVILPGGVEVEVRTAVAYDKANRGLQLGIDFFRQARFAQVDVWAAGDPSVLCQVQPGLGSDNMRVKKREAAADRHDELRVYSEEGGIARAALQHCNDGIAGLVQVSAEALVDECSWCGRVFPGLMICPVCRAASGTRVCYCSKACQKAAWPQHKLTPPHAREGG